jgi:hypothetical protein
MKKILILSIVSLLCQICNAVNLIAVKGNSGTSFYKNLDSAIYFANAGDTLYLPGGGFNINNPIAKELHIIGAGCFLDSANATGISVINYFNFTNGSSNSSVEGCYVNSLVDIDSNLSNLKFVRNLLKGIRCKYSCANISIIENVILSNCLTTSTGCEYSIYLQGSNHLISNNIIKGVSWQNYSTVKNNYLDFYGIAYTGSSTVQGNNNVYENNIGRITTYNSYVTNSIFKNNINIGIGINSIDAYNNQSFTNFFLSSIVDSLFINPTPNPFIVSDYQLKPNSIYKTLGTNGTEIGIFGGAFPMKAGQVPFNPHFREAVINASTNSNGSLNIKLKVASQER